MLTYSIEAHGDHKYLRDLSRNVIRGQVAAARTGSWIGHRPLGYQIDGEKKHKRLIPDPVEAEIIRRIFREWVYEVRGLTEIADRLNKDGVPSGKGGKWKYDAVRAILENVVYISTFRYNVNSRSKYHSYQSGEIVPKGKRGLNDESDWIIKENNHEPIIDRETFDRAQELLAKQPGGHRHNAEDNPFFLNGLLRCGHCGEVMWGYLHRGTPRYECSRQRDKGDCPGHGCSVKEADLFRYLGDYLEQWLGFDAEWLGTAAYYGELKADELPKAFAEIKKLVTPRSMPKRQRESLGRQIERLKADVMNARRNLSRTKDPDSVPYIERDIRNWEEQRKKLEQELDQAKLPAEKDINAVALEVLHHLSNLHYMCRTLASLNTSMTRAVVESITAMGR